MKRKTMKMWMAAAAASLGLAGCGGGSGGIDGTGVQDTGVSYGTITGFGSVWVNGVEFSTSGTTIKLDDNSVTQNELRVGMVVRVDGSIDDRRASTITVDDAVKGRVEQVIDANRMVVMGQTVQIDAQTRFENSVVPAVGDYVEVHGLPVADGTIAAGYIQRKTALADPPYVVKGFVKSHVSTPCTFVIGTLAVSCSVALTNDMPAGSWNGQLVEVKGSTCAGNPVCGTLSASKVEPGGARVQSIAKAEVEGFVTQFTSASAFTVGAQRVLTTASTVYEGGVAGDIALGTKLEAEGPISGGVLTAVKISFRDNVRIEGDIETVSAGTGVITIAGLPGVTVRVTSLTELKDVGSLGDLANGNHLRIKARGATGTTVQAIELERRSISSDSRVILQGPVEAKSGTVSLTILGVAIDTSTVSDSDFRNLADAPIGRAAFFAAVAVGDLVKARGSRSGAAVTWDQMELED